MAKSHMSHDLFPLFLLPPLTYNLILLQDNRVTIASGSCACTNFAVCIERLCMLVCLSMALPFDDISMALHPGLDAPSPNLWQLLLRPSESSLSDNLLLAEPDDYFASFPSPPSHAWPSATSSRVSLPFALARTMLKDPFRKESEELLAPKPHGTTSNSPDSPESSASAPIGEQLRRSSSSRLPKNVRLLDYIDRSRTSPGPEKTYVHRTISPSPTERIEEEQMLTTRKTHDQVSALPAADGGSLRRSESTKTTLSTLRNSFKDARRPSTGSSGQNKTLVSLGHIGGPLFNSNKGHKKETKEFKEDAEAPSLRKPFAKEVKHLGPMYHFLNPSKGLREDIRAPAKITRPKPARPGIKDLFARINDKGNADDNGSEEIVYESFWSAGKKTPRRRAGTYHGHPPNKAQRGSGDSEYLPLGARVSAGRKPSKAPTLPDILPQPSFESEVRFDIRKFDDEPDTNSAISSSDLSAVSDQATAASDSSPEPVTEVTRPTALSLSRARSRQVSQRPTQKIGPEASKKKPSVVVQNLEDPFHVETPTTESSSENTSKESEVLTTQTLATIGTPILASKDFPQLVPAERDTTLWGSIQSSLRSDSPNKKTHRPAVSSQRSITPRKRWKHADKNYFPPWAIGMPQDKVIWFVQRDQELSRL